MKEKKYDIEERLIDFGVDILVFIKKLISIFVKSIETASKPKHTS